MDDPESRRKNFTVYTSEEKVPEQEKDSPLETLLNGLRTVGLQENGVARARDLLVRAGVTDNLLREVRNNAEEKTRRTREWTRENPRKAGGMAVIALLIGLFVIFTERRS